METNCIQFVTKIISVQDKRFSITVPKREIALVDLEKEYLVTLTPINKKQAKVQTES